MLTIYINMMEICGHWRKTKGVGGCIFNNTRNHPIFIPMVET